MASNHKAVVAIRITGTGEMRESIEIAGIAVAAQGTTGVRQGHVPTCSVRTVARFSPSATIKAP